MNDADANSNVVALHYARRDATQVVLNNGELLAEHLAATALKHDIQHDLDPALASSLAHVKLSPEIPQELYQAAAAVLAFAWRVAK
jgi:type III secretion system FlhB-like substrate exporter